MSLPHFSKVGGGVRGGVAKLSKLYLITPLPTSPPLQAKGRGVRGSKIKLRFDGQNCW